MLSLGCPEQYWDKDLVVSDRSTGVGFTQFGGVSTLRLYAAPPPTNASTIGKMISDAT